MVAYLLQDPIRRLIVKTQVLQDFLVVLLLLNLIPLPLPKLGLLTIPIWRLGYTLR